MRWIALETLIDVMLMLSQILLDMARGEDFKNDVLVRLPPPSTMI